MSYLSHAQDPSRKATALTVTIAVHAAVAVVLVTGLSYPGFIKTRDRTPIIDIPLPPDPPPKDEIVPDTPKTQDLVAPPPLIDLTPVTPILEPVPQPAVMASVAAVFEPVAQILAPVPPIFQSIPPVFAPVAHILDAVTQYRTTGRTLCHQWSGTNHDEQRRSQRIHCHS